jgi:S1-C subfamily serine protease
MRKRHGRDRGVLSFPLVLFVACVMAVAVTVRLDGDASSATGNAGLSPVERRALARQATLRVAAASCDDVTDVTTGSGFIVGDWLLTNEHVVRGATELKADQPIDSVILPIVGLSRTADLAATPAPGGVSLVLAEMPAEVADPVLVAGHAGGGAIETQPGVIVNRVWGSSFGFDGDVLLIDVATTAGYSGGPVFDTNGDVVGMLSGFDRSTQLTVAVPADEIAAFMEGLAGQTVGLDVERCSVG